MRVFLLTMLLCVVGCGKHELFVDSGDPDIVHPVVYEDCGSNLNMAGREVLENGGITSCNQCHEEVGIRTIETAEQQGNTDFFFLYWKE